MGWDLTFPISRHLPRHLRRLTLEAEAGRIGISSLSLGGHRTVGMDNNLATPPLFDFSEHLSPSNRSFPDAVLGVSS